MIIIAESGATKTDWRSVSKDGTVLAVQTSGMNPAVHGMDYLSKVMAEAIPSVNPEGRQVECVFFYGAGLVSAEVAAMLTSLLDMWCPFANIEFHSDLEAAAKALFGDGTGVAAIIGTGSNSCLVEKGEIVRNIRPGGYVLGDEGSGAALGRMFLADVVKELVPQELACRFEQQFGLDYAAIVKGVYRSESPSGYLGSFARFICENRDLEYAEDLIRENFRFFIVRALSRYGVTKVGVVGSLGYACRDILAGLGKEYGLEFVRFVKAPIEELVDYHRKKIYNGI